MAQDHIQTLRKLLAEKRGVLLPGAANALSARIIADLGILYSANAYANLDVKSPPQRLKGMLDNLNPGIIVTSAAHAPTLRDLGIAEDRLLLIEQAMVSEEIYDNAALLERLEAVIDTDPYCIIHTSGSTGIPKGVALSHRCTLDFVDWAFERLSLDGTLRPWIPVDNADGTSTCALPQLMEF